MDPIRHFAAEAGHIAQRGFERAGVLSYRAVCMIWNNEGILRN